MVNAQAELLGFSGAENPKALWYMEIKGVREGKKIKYGKTVCVCLCLNLCVYLCVCGVC